MFQGFSPETIDFLWGIRMNNNREWFGEHKQQYVDTLYEPMKALAAEISQKLCKYPGMICKTSRIYRDMRIPHDTPYKESLWICIRRDSTWWMREPSLFFEITPDGFSYGFLFYDPTVQMMDEMRKDMAAHPEEFLKMVKSIQRKSGLRLTGNTYKRKKPCPEKKVEEFFQLKNVMMIHEEPVSEKLFSAELATTVRKCLEALYPLCQYCQRFADMG